MTLVLVDQVKNTRNVTESDIPQSRSVRLRRTTTGIKNVVGNNMKSELLDVVDENNKPLGITKERVLVHKEGDWHNTVHIYVFNDKNEILVHFRAPFKDLHPNCWDTRFGGHVLAGHILEDSALKELEEESGIKAKREDLTKGFTYKYDGIANREFCNAYYYKFKKHDSINFNDNEVVDVKWMSIENIIKSIKKNPEKWATRLNTIKDIYEQWEMICSKR